MRMGQIVNFTYACGESAISHLCALSSFSAMVEAVNSSASFDEAVERIKSAHPEWNYNTSINVKGSRCSCSCHYSRMAWHWRIHAAVSGCVLALWGQVKD